MIYTSSRMRHRSWTLVPGAGSLAAMARNIKLLKEIGAQVRVRRETRSWTQEQLAERCGLQAESISRIETGAVSASLTSLAAIADALATTVGSLVDGAPGMANADAFAGAWSQLTPAQQRLVAAVIREFAKQ